MANSQGPTLEEIRAWPAAVSVAQASKAFGFSKSHGSRLASCGEFPVRVIKAGGRYVVPSADIVQVLSATSGGTALDLVRLVQMDRESQEGDTELE